MTDVFDDMLTATSDTGAETQNETESEWPKLVNLPAGERPEGTVIVSEFVDIVNKALIRERMAALLGEGVDPLDASVQAADAALPPSTFYQSVKAQRNPLPHYVVRSEIEVDERDSEGNVTGTKTETVEKTYIPTDVALEWWKNRPTRGAAGAARSEEDVAKRLVRAGNKIANLTAAEARLAKTQALVEKLREQVAKYDEWLAADGKTREDAVKAHEAKVEKDEAEKAIADDE